MKQGKIVATPQVLIGAFGLPEDTTFIGCRSDIGICGLMVEIFVSHNDLPEVAEGEVIPQIHPTISRNEKGELSLMSWGIKKDGE